MKHKIILLGEPGTGKSTCGLSYPGVEQHVWGSTEQHTSLGFKGRTDILNPVVFNWRDQLTVDDQKLFNSPDEKVDVLARHKSLIPVVSKAKARNVAKYIDYLEQLSLAVKQGKRTELHTVFLDNLTPFSEDLWIYTEVLHADDYTEKTGFKLHEDYKGYLNHVLDLLMQIDLHTVVSCHVQMALDEETASTTNFLEQQKVAQKKQWQPFVMGKYKYKLAGKFDHAFYLFTEESAGQKTKYYAKLEADSANVGVAKARIQPFDKPNKIALPQYSFYQFFNDALEAHNKGGK